MSATKSKFRARKIIFDVSNPEQDNPILVRAVVKAGGHIVSISEVRRTLEEIYLKVMGETA